MQRSHFIGILLLLAGTFSLSGQSADSLLYLDEQTFLKWVLTHHPLAMQAALAPQLADAQLTEARGAFDPKLYADWEQKSFDGKSYFNIADAGVKYPTWFGLELKGAWQQTSGIYLNPQQNLPERGQAILGIKANLLQGLLIDQRRADLRVAQYEQERASAGQQDLLNTLVLQAMYAYWDWTVAYNKVRLYDQALSTTRQRLYGIRESFLAGNKPEIDTIETNIQVQQRQFDCNQARLEFRNAGLALSNFLWYEGQQPMRISDAMVPQPPSWETAAALPVTANVLAGLYTQHPVLQDLQLQREQLSISRKLAAEQLKPKLAVEYNFLGDGTDFLPSKSNANDAAFTDLFTQNYKWGLTFEFPLFLRKARGKLEQTRLKIAQTELKLKQKQQELYNKILQYDSELENAQAQILLYTDMVASYQQLLDAEIYKFSLGSSSVFLINSREQKLLDAQIKLAELVGKYWQIRAALLWAGGSR